MVRSQTRTAPGTALHAVLATVAVALLVAAGHAGGPADAAMAASTSAARSAQPPATGTASFTKLDVKGTGCRPDTVVVTVSPDREAFTVIYSKFFAQAGGGAVPADGKRACTITVGVDLPRGAAFAVEQVDYRGYAYLEPGAAATHAARYQIPGRGQPKSSQRNFTGFYDDNWQVTDVVPTAQRNFGSCTAAHRMTIETTLQVTSAPEAPVSMITMDSTDAALASTYHLSWKTCQPLQARPGE